MGAKCSSLQGDSGNSGGMDFGDMPESCIAVVLSFLEPPEIAKLARVSRAFSAAASADFIWVPKLPPNYDHILANFPDGGAGCKTKKDVYAAFCRPTIFDGGTKEVWIDKRTGGLCFAISSMALSITGINDRRYWNRIPTSESRFQTVAYLHQIWWVEVDGELEFQFPAGTYSIFFRLGLGKPCMKMGRRAWNLENVHGWDAKPVEFSLKTNKDGKIAAVSRVMLENIGSWANYHAGNFTVEDPNEQTRIKFSLAQIDVTHSKGGLCVDSVFICPSTYVKHAFSVVECR